MHTPEPGCLFACEHIDALRTRLEKAEAELECGGPHSAAEIHRMDEVHAEETDAYQATIAGLKKMNKALRNVVTDRDRRIAELKVEVGVERHVVEELRARIAKLEKQPRESCAWSCVGVPKEQRGEAHRRTCR